MGAAVVPEDVRRLALHPFRELPLNPETLRVELDGAVVGINPFPTAQVVDLRGDGPGDVEGAVEAARAAAREHGKPVLAWWLAPEHAHFGPQLEALGLVNADTPGFEATEHALALVTPPAGRAPEAVEARETESFDDFLAAQVVLLAGFGLPELPVEDLRRRYDKMVENRSFGRQVIALLEGRIIGTSFAALADAGVNLFGGAVAEDARGRGAYRAMVMARWELAVERGTPALTVQAGKMSRPILERLGFVPVGDVLVYVDTLEI